MQKGMDSIMKTTLIRHGRERLLVQSGRLCAQPGEVLKDVMRHGDKRVYVVYRSARLRKGFVTVPSSLGPVKRLCTKHEITERLAMGRPRSIGSDGDYVWVFDKDSSEIIGRV